MTKNSFKDLVVLTEVSFRSRLSEMQALTSQESALRKDLELIDQQNLLSRKYAEDYAIMQKLGSDLLWHGWTDQQRTKLNTQLANILAQKESLQYNLSLAFGKSIAAEALYSKEMLNRVKSNQKYI